MGLQGKRGLDGKKVFTRKPYDTFLYKWAPLDDKVKNVKRQQPDKPFFCNATPNSQGEDFITTYVYDQVNENGQIRRFAYVECDYVK